MKTNHTTHEFDFHFTHRVELDFSPLLRSFAMGLFEDLSAKIDEAKQAAVAEHQEVMDAIAALKTGVGSDPNLDLTADQKTQLVGMIDDLKMSIQNVHDASVAPTPTPTGTTGTSDVTGTVPPTPAGPTPAPAPTPNPNPGP